MADKRECRAQRLSKRLTLRISPNLFERLDRLSAAERRPLPELIRITLEDRTRDTVSQALPRARNTRSTIHPADRSLPTRKAVRS
jgi:predicted DNA-binding protein